MDCGERCKENLSSRVHLWDRRSGEKILRRKIAFILATSLLATSLALSVQEAARTTDANAPIPQKLKDFLLKAAEKGDVNAQYSVGLMYFVGEGVQQDYTEAVKWLRKAAEQGNADAQTRLGVMYGRGKGVPPDASEAVRWFTKAAEQGRANAQANLGGMYHRGEGVQKDDAEAVKWLTKAAEQAEVNAQALLGGMYYTGEGVDRNFGEAQKWFRRAAEQGEVNAQVLLGGMYQNAEGVQQDYTEAVKWLRKAAEQGNADAQTRLGVMYGRGEGIQKDDMEAVKWLTKAAEQGYVYAQASLAGMYYYGKGVQKDDAEAVKWLTKAAEQGEVNAQVLLGSHYYGGEGVQKDYGEAVKWYHKAAVQGSSQAQWELAMMYYKGEGVLEDYAEAYKWVLLAGLDGDRGAQNLKEILRKKMTPRQIEEGQRLAKEFLAKRERDSKEGKQQMPNVTATGFLIAVDGYLLTACHAVEKASKIEVLYQQKPYPAKVIVEDEATDMAVLKIDGTGFACLSVATSATVKTGDRVFTVEFPQVAVQGAEPKFTEGSISSLSGPSGSPRFFQISVPVQPGNSGGPLVNEKGEIVGLIVSRLDDVAALLATGSVPQTVVNYAVKSSFVLPLMESVPGLLDKLVKPPATIDRSTAIENTKKAVVLVVAYKDRSASKDSRSP